MSSNCSYDMDDLDDLRDIFCVDSDEGLESLRDFLRETQDKDKNFAPSVRCIGEILNNEAKELAKKQLPVASNEEPIDDPEIEKDSPVSVYQSGMKEKTFFNSEG